MELERIQVLVEYDGVDWQRREWVAVHSRRTFRVFLVERTLVWAPKKYENEEVKWPALNLLGSTAENVSCLGGRTGRAGDTYRSDEMVYLIHVSPRPLLDANLYESRLTFFTQRRRSLRYPPWMLLSKLTVSLSSSYTTARFNSWTMPTFNHSSCPGVVGRSRTMSAKQGGGFPRETGSSGRARFEADLARELCFDVPRLPDYHPSPATPRLVPAILIFRAHAAPSPLYYIHIQEAVVASECASSKGAARKLNEGPGANDWDARLAGSEAGVGADLLSSLCAESAEWRSAQDGQRILTSTPSVLGGCRAQVYRVAGATQWYTAVIVGVNEHTGLGRTVNCIYNMCVASALVGRLRTGNSFHSCIFFRQELTVTDDTVLEEHSEDPALVQMRLLGDGVIESIMRGEVVGVMPRRSRSNLQIRISIATSAGCRGSSGAPAYPSNPILSAPPSRLPRTPPIPHTRCCRFTLFWLVSGCGGCARAAEQWRGAGDAVGGESPLLAPGPVCAILPRRHDTNTLCYSLLRKRIERENNKSPATTGGRKKQAAVRSNGQIAAVEPPPQQQTGKVIHKSYNCDFPLP
ncbi:hypothetical protein RR48_11821 [Papilio machaon]|uniref:Lysine-specific demethylase 3A/B tudor domain-containing protein n=1 Tax=Papilio machaon TaxID=76193 RepID=A0A194QN40_PAPMA|nr:hypothetical protein RR48_11821 [Papilio machaon]